MSAAFTSRASLTTGGPLVSEAAARTLGYAALASKLIALGSSDAPSCLERGGKEYAENSGSLSADLNAP